MFDRLTSMRNLRLTAGVVAVAAAGITAYVFDPVGGPLPYPRCWIKLLTGYDCPGCGSARALHSLLHGHVAEAWAFNPALFFAIPLIMLAFAAEHPRFARMRRLLLSPPAAYTLLLLTLLYTILRNL